MSTPREELELLMPVLVEECPSEVVCFRGGVFSYFMSQELARAERYGSFVSLLVIRFAVGNGVEQAEVAFAIGKILRSQLRKTDLIGMPEPSLFSVSLLHSKVENAQKVLARLALEISMQVPNRTRLLGLETGAAVFPTEANSLESMWSLARARLTRSNQPQ